MTENIAFEGVSLLLAHETPSILIDRIESCESRHLVALTRHDKRSLYSDERGNVPIWVGIEYMAQAICAYAGIKSLQKNEPIRIGLLLGARHYKTFTAQFKKDCPVTIEVEEMFIDETNLVMFDCKITDRIGGHLCATAQIKAILSDNIDEILGGI